MTQDTDQRPNPDELLARYRAEELKTRRGKLKIFFGASAGVGKTYAMLLAARLDLPWHAVYVETARLQRLPAERRRRILKTLKLAQDLGAVTATLPAQDVAAAVVAYARKHNLAKLVIYATRPGWLATGKNGRGIFI